jgi:lipopolysaccharide export system protein LptC
MNPLPALWLGVRRGWDRVALYLPLMLMAVLALVTWWLVRSTPPEALPQAERPVRHEPDYRMSGVALRVYDAQGRMRTEIFGEEARHYADDDSAELDRVRLRSRNKDGQETLTQANQAMLNGMGDMLELRGSVRVTKPASAGQPKQVYTGEYLRVQSDPDRMQSHLPMQFTRGEDQFSADRFSYDDSTRQVTLEGRVRGVVMPRPPSANGR